MTGAGIVRGVTTALRGLGAVVAVWLVLDIIDLEHWIPLLEGLTIGLFLGRNVWVKKPQHESK
jgi:hypothetical protein